MSVRRRHRMPCGAEPTDDGVRFRLWAPAAGAVELLLHEPRETLSLPMHREPDGWYEISTSAARTESRYRFRIDGRLEVPDPAARANEDVSGPSIVVDPLAYEWRDADWRGRPWSGAVIYELHVGTFSPEGTFAGVESKLDHLARLGITVIELMPIGEFPGSRGWGYDGVLLYAPDAAYGTPHELKSLVDAAHRRGLAIMLDVVYNHFGPEGNWLHAYAPQFFTDRHCTPWGAGINFDGPASRCVRDFFIHNALYWLEEYHFDGLRIDAVHAMRDDSEVHFISELAQTVRAGPGSGREIFLVLENGANEAHFLAPRGRREQQARPALAPENRAETSRSSQPTSAVERPDSAAPEREPFAACDAQWNDDLHHCLHVILTGETDGYYVDYAEQPRAMLCRCLAEGFAYQGEASAHAGGRARGEPSAHLPPTAFVNFLQNHDQIGNRARGERLVRLAASESALVAATAIVLLAPSPPLLFMGEEWAATEPFAYFCDFDPELAQKVREGRKREFARFERFGAEALPDPAAPATFQSARLDWRKLAQPSHAGWLQHYRRLLHIRRRDIVPRIPRIRESRCVRLEDHGTLAVDWLLDDGSALHLIANLADATAPFVGRAAGRALYCTHPDIRRAVRRNALEPWSVTWLLERSSGAA